ncbi:MAG TPA: glycosyltransferase [Kiritimatiellia bacterium]|nr:glycosyltransferase [Kiritimatiellia bacterium]HMO97916.1 glycosyltransferase [Kiritimatiellia bacterium]HMP95565.1 glycosyltransferase [Kiritimatiellia bacterium]
MQPHDSTSFRLSVVIPTMGRPILRKTLDSLMETDWAADLDIIVVGPIPQGPTLDYLVGMRERHANIRHLPVSFAKGDASEKRNAGYRESKAAIIAFIDDDVYVPPHWPQTVSDCFREPDVGMVSGPSLVPTDITLLARLAGLALSSKAAGYVAHRYIKGNAEARRVKWSRTIGCNMIFSRAAFEKIVKFDPDFYPGEEMIAAHGVTQSGFALVFHPEAYVYHYPKQTFRGFWRQIYRYGATRIRLIRAGLDVEWTPLVPAVWVFSLVALGIGAIFHPWFLWLLWLDIGLYGLVAAWIAAGVVWETKRWSDALLFFIQPFMHLSYGVGIWMECFRPDKDLGDAVGKPTT